MTCRVCGLNTQNARTLNRILGLALRHFLVHSFTRLTANRQVAGAVVGAFALKLALPPALDETPFTTTGSLTFTHPFQVFRDQTELRLS